MFKYVDLFAGCGGLSLGMERNGGELVVGVEKSDMAARTFFHNLIGDASDPRAWTDYVNAELTEQFDAGMLVRPLSDLLEADQLVENLAAREIDVIVGGPPCQGFSLAGRRNPDDVRNKLPWEYLELVERTSPKAVVIENVVGMNQRFATQEESSFQQLQQALRETGDGYEVQGVMVNALHYGAPQHRPRLMIIGLRSDVADRLNIKSTGMLWKSAFTDELNDVVPPLAPIPTVSSKNAVTVADALVDNHGSAGSTARRKSYLSELKDKSWKIAQSGHGAQDGAVLNHLPRKHTDRVIKRFHFYQFISANGLEPRMLTTAARIEEDSGRADYLRKVLKSAPLPARAPDGYEIANSLESLVGVAQSLVTRKHSQKVLQLNKPARTVVTLPDDYVHPTEPRIFTVRELARFQGFPDRFEFLGKETTGAHRRRVEVPQYSQVGNAVSPMLSKAVGSRIAEILES